MDPNTVALPFCKFISKNEERSPSLKEESAHLLDIMGPTLMVLGVRGFLITPSGWSLYLWPSPSPLGFLVTLEDGCQDGALDKTEFTNFVRFLCMYRLKMGTDTMVSQCA